MDNIIKKVIEKIEDAGFTAYVVGGYVRDQLLGILSYDVDICTNALPKDIHNLFNLNSCNNYGGSNLKIGKYNIDITTFRQELNYENRKPVEIKYIDNIEEDVKRRDFTINAICMDSEGKILDFLNGVDDLNMRIIASIGNPYEKMKEDPLRILRAIRFATILDFDIDPKLYDAMKENASLVATLSNERVKQEYSKILMSKNFKKGLDLSQKLGINEILGITYDEVCYTSDLLGMFSQVSFKNMTFTNSEKSNIIKITEVVKGGIIDNFTLYKYGLYIATTAGTILNYNPKDISAMYNNLCIKDRKDIAITSQEIMDLLQIEPKYINKIYEDLESKLLKNEIINDNKEIKEYLKQHKG